MSGWAYFRFAESFRAGESEGVWWIEIARAQVIGQGAEAALCTTNMSPGCQKISCLQRRGRKAASDAGMEQSARVFCDAVAVTCRLVLRSADTK